MDEIALTIPHDRDFGAIADLVLGGIAARMELTVEHLDDIQLALGSLIEREQGSGHVTVHVRVGADTLAAEVGPFTDAVAAELAAGGHGIGLRRLLDTVADTVTVSQRDGETWVELAKRVERTGGDGGSA